MQNQENILKTLYFDPSGFQSQQKIYSEAKKQDKTITSKFVKEWYLKNVEKTRYYGGKNSFVAPHANYEYQVDLFFVSDGGKAALGSKAADLENQTYNIGMACIDIFTKYATVVTLKSKKPDDFLAGLMECLKNMKGKPKYIFSDNEGSINSKDVLGYLEKEKIDVITTRNHAHFVERFIRTFKLYLRKRIDYDLKQGKTDIQWHTYIYPIMLTYNNKNEHSTTNMKPSDAIKEDNRLDVKINLELKAKRDRRYPELKVGDKVKIMLRYNKFRKEHNPLYSDSKYEIEKIEQKHGLNMYIVNGRPRLKNELLKIA